MKIKYYTKIENEDILCAIRNLLILCDKEFVPPLSGRNSTTQTSFSPEDTPADIPEPYFEKIASQSALVAFENERVVAFMSFKKNYVCEHIPSDLTPNIYITTVIVHPDCRHNGIAGKFYSEMIKRFKKYYLFVRTWSTNAAHIRILSSMGFHEHCYLNNDRGNGIDTIYYIYTHSKTSLKQYINQYRLSGNIFFFSLLSVISILFIFIWINSDSEIVHELSLAVATSFMASVLCLLSDTFLKIRESKNDKFISTLKSFGIENLQFNKNELLEKAIPNCRKEIWISGYRLIMTSKPSFRNALVAACKRSKNMTIRILAVPPWSKTYSLVYGEEDTSLNYIYIFKDLVNCMHNYGLNLEIRFTEKPIFSDTYKIDDRFITGPYLFCADRYKNRITAKDFFSLDIINKEKELYQLIMSDYTTIWDEAYAELDNELFFEKLSELENEKSITVLSKQEKESLLQSSCKIISEKYHS